MSKKDYFYGTGRRKTSSARVFLKTGTGLFHIKSFKKQDDESKNKKKAIDVKKYFIKPEQIKTVFDPFQVLNLKKSFDVLVTVKGGGFTGQAEAIRHGVTRALLKVSAEYRPTLKKSGFLTRDPRMVERKKYGHHKARKSTQFSKR
ncbi:MAG: 30S ribosomal protein S9 [Bdellovibrionaceae bacterium]|nr:30S ribosomal protein S9 [Pseudobdellovibrionaceae bacterium]